MRYVVQRQAFVTTFDTPRERHATEAYICWPRRHAARGKRHEIRRANAARAVVVARYGDDDREKTAMAAYERCPR